MRPRLHRGIYLLPNLCTTGNLFCGFYAIVHSLNGDFARAGWAILFAGVFDFMDGQVARMTKSFSEFGKQYDSLVDSASFGLAPGILVYTWSLNRFHRLGWLVAFLFFACGALRLARFNVQSRSVEKKHFQGLPIPAAAALVAGWVLFYDEYFGAIAGKDWIGLILTSVAAVLMVSTLRYRSFKGLDLWSRQSFYFLVGVVGVLFLISLEPNLVIFLGAAAYVFSGLLEAFFLQRVVSLDGVQEETHLRWTASRVRKLRLIRGHHRDQGNA